LAEREFMEYDVVIVGAGPSGLAAAIRLKQLSAERGHELSVCVLEKGSEVGAHILSGAVLEPRALNELLPEWKALGAPLNTPAGDDRFLWLTQSKAFRLPTPPQMHNAGNYIISLGNLCRWLGQQAEGFGVEIYPGFAAAEVLYGEDGSVRGVATGDLASVAMGNRPSAINPAWNCVPDKRYLPKVAAVRSPRRCSSASGYAKAPIRRPTPSGSRSCGKSINQASRLVSPCIR
jgi:electron-transferring-flavoprotein dehydrogenase